MYVSSSPIYDDFANSIVVDYVMFGRPVPVIYFEENGFEWSTKDVYYFDKYDIELSKEFVEYVLENT